MTKPLTEAPTDRHGVDMLSTGMRRVFVRDLILPARIGIYEHEKSGPQRVRINLDLEVEDGPPQADEIDCVVSYEPLVLAARDILAAGHIALLETLAEQLAAECLSDPRVRLARVRLEKLDAFPDAESVGIEIIRHRPDSASLPDPA